MNSIPYARQSITQADIDAVVEVLKSDWLTSGPAIERFEKAVAQYCGVSYAVAVSNATAALHLGALALQVGPGNRVWTSPITFVASANCALYCGAQVDFVDIDPSSYNISVNALERKLVEASAKNQLPKLVIPVHLTGQSCEMEKIQALAKKYGFRVMEDAAHAIGGSRTGKKIGSCQYSDLTVLSFHPVKIITTGEGGMALTNDSELALRLRLLRSHGIIRDPKLMGNKNPPPWYYEQITLGYNYRMTDMQAALGLSQLSRIDEFVARRHAIARRYNEKLGHLPIVLPEQDPNGRSAYHLYVIRLKSHPHRLVFESMRAQGIEVNLHYIPVPSQPYYKELGFLAHDYPEALRYGETAISLPMYYDLTTDQQDRVIAALQSSLESQRWQ